jgi:hypothetical protein
MSKFKLLMAGQKWYWISCSGFVRVVPINLESIRKPRLKH